MTNGRSDLATLAQAMFALALDIDSEDGIANAAIAEAGARLSQCQAAVTLAAKQAEDDGLWFRAQTAPEAYLQAALRDLAAAVEAMK